MAFKQGTITPYWQKVMAALYNSKDDRKLNIMDVCKKIGVYPNFVHVHGIINHLSTVGYVKLQKVGREKLIVLTDKGKYIGRILSDLKTTLEERKP